MKRCLFVVCLLFVSSLAFAEDVVRPLACDEPDFEQKSVDKMYQLEVEELDAKSKVEQEMKSAYLKAAKVGAIRKDTFDNADAYAEQLNEAEKRVLKSQTENLFCRLRYLEKRVRELENANGVSGRD